MSYTARMRVGRCAEHWLALTLAAALVLVCRGSTEVAQQQQQIVSQEHAESPYLLVGSSFNIFRMFLNDTPLQSIVTESRISAVAFHYRMGHIYWINSLENCIKRATMDGTNITAVVSGDISNPADLAVDWIHDKLYWSDSDLKIIEEVDLHTLERRVVVQLPSNSNPLGLAVYPMVDHGILYWTDNSNHNLQRIITTGSSHAIIYQNIQCIRPIALNLKHKMVYWTNQCAFSIESVFINGTNREFVVESDPEAVRFPRGMSQFEDTVYWVQPSKIYKKTGSVMTLLYYGMSSQVLQDVQVVHPKSQPTIEQLQELGEESEVYTGCSDGCQNGGNCVFPGICECPNGWAGLACEEDVDECQTANGGCLHICNNTDGGFHCSCPEGYNMSQNGSNCTEVAVSPFSSIIEVQPTQTSTLPSPPPTIPSLTVEPDIQPTNLATTSTSSPSQPTLNPTTTTSYQSPTTSTHSANKPSTTDSVDILPTPLIDDVSPTSSQHVPTTTTDSPTPSSPPVVIEEETTTEVTEGNGVVSTSSPSATKSADSDVRETPLPTSGPDSYTMDYGINPTLSGINKAEDDEGSNPLVFIIPVSVVAGFVVLSIVVFVFTMTYVHCRNQHQGSYSFANPEVLEIAGEISTNTIKRGQVTRTSFKQISSTPNVPETMAILSQPRDTRSSSTMSRSDSFEWNNRRESQ